MSERSLNSFLSSTITGKRVFIHWNRERRKLDDGNNRLYTWNYYKVLAVDEVFGMLHLEGIHESADVKYPGLWNRTEIVPLAHIERISLEKR